MANVLTEKEGLSNLLRIIFPSFIICLLYSIVVITLEEWYGDHLYSISPQTGSVLGIAVAFFLGFRMNSAYDRWWEARKTIGELTYNSRTFSSKVCVYYSNKTNLNAASQPNNLILSNKLLNLLSLYIIQFRNQLHNLPTTNANEFIADSEELPFSSNVKNKANYTLQVMTRNIDTSIDKNASMVKYDLMVIMNKFHEIQGKAERTKNTPFLNIYKAFTRIIVISYVLLLPFFMGDIDLGGEDSLLELLAIPIITLVGTIFLVINKLSNMYGDPFSKNSTSFALTTITENILAEIREVIEQNKAVANTH